jgi:GNAT superfamily N-acetyltransferase
MAEREARLVIVAAGPEELANLDPQSCRGCAYWETTGRYPSGESRSALEHRKREWYRQQGVGGKIAYLGNQWAGYLQYGPPAAFPRIAEYAVGPPSDDALFVGCLFVAPGARGKGIGRALLEAAEAEAVARNYAALETFARRGSANNPSGPLAFYLNRGYQILLGDARFPLVRKIVAAPGA